MSDPRIEILHQGLWRKSIELDIEDKYNANTHFLALAHEVVKILDEYYGSKRYWMAVEFERERVLREIEQKVDEIRDANIPS